jgi:hypothetical protein
VRTIALGNDEHEQYRGRNQHAHLDQRDRAEVGHGDPDEQEGGAPQGA